MSIDDPINDADSDMREVESCRHCLKLIQPGAAIQWNGWSWHAYCVPVHVLYEQQEKETSSER